jgi:uncharacterized phage protein (TIGR02220 family)
MVVMNIKRGKGMATRQKSVSRSILRSEKFWELSSDNVRLFFILLLLNLDNIGRGLANKYYLKGKIYEKSDATAERCEDFLTECSDVGLLIYYEIEGVKYVQDPKHLNHNKIVGNMKAESVYPEPPQALIEKWCNSTGQVYTLSNLIKLNLSEDKDKDKDKDIKTGLKTNPSLINKIVEDLNKQCSTSYKPTSQKTRKYISARIREGFKFEDFQRVHRIKCAEWKGTDMEKYLRPETLYGTKFESYLNQKEKSGKKYV